MNIPDHATELLKTIPPELIPVLAHYGLCQMITDSGSVDTDILLPRIVRHQQSI